MNSVRTDRPLRLLFFLQKSTSDLNAKNWSHNHERSRVENQVRWGTTPET